MLVGNSVPGFHFVKEVRGTDGMRILLFSLSSFATGCFITAGSRKWAHPGKDRHSIQYLKFFCQKKDSVKSQ